MPTRIATLERERSLRAVARRVFDLGDNPDAEQQRRAEAALLAANPRLASREGFSRGATIVVPSVAGLRPSPEAIGAEARPKGLTQEAAARLRAGVKLVEERFGKSDVALEDTLGKLRSDSFRAELQRALPDAEPLFKSAEEALEKKRRRNEEGRRRLTGALNQALEAVEELEALAEKAGAP